MTADPQAPSWKTALADAEEKLRQAKMEVLKWQAVVLTCRDKIKQNAPWPGEKA